MRESLEELRKLIPETPGEVHLNAGTLSPTPLPIQHAVAALRHEQAARPSIFFFRDGAIHLARSRSALATFLNIQPNNLFLLPNVTHAMNLALRSIDWNEGDEVLTTAHEYGAMLLILEGLKRSHGIDIKLVALPDLVEAPSQFVVAFEAAITKKTRALFFSHVSSPSGIVFPAQAICDLARRNGIFSIVDGAHGPGMVEVDLAAIGADAYGANAHKWMMSPCGAGFLQVSDRLKPLLKPLVQGWGDAPFNDPDSDSPDLPGSTRLQHRLEYHGVADRTPQMVLPETIAFLSRVDLPRAFARVRALHDYTRDRLAEKGLKCASPLDPALVGAMTVFDVEPCDPATTMRRLWAQAKVLCPITRMNGRHFLRVSHAWFNTPQEIDVLAKTIQSLGMRS